MAVEIRGVIASQTASDPDPLFVACWDFLALSLFQRNSLFFECHSILPQELLSYVRRAVGFPSAKLPTIALQHFIFGQLLLGAVT